jgi:KUP system potassium uptake protein
MNRTAASAEPSEKEGAERSTAPRGPLPALALAAIGIVFGDIGTSPLYTLSSVFEVNSGVEVTQGNIVGVVSLIVWSLLVVVSLKYVALVMRASNAGEGGIMALLALVTSSVKERPRLKSALLIAGVFGAALFYGDGVITPAISVLSAVEGLKVAAPHLQRFVIPVSLIVLVALFLFQRRGTSGIGAVFGPVMSIWFVALAALGLVNIIAAPAILAALNPLAAISFLSAHGWVAYVSLGSVVLALTGAEALYADMGHFGALPIRLSWFLLVFPALGLNYLGQGALLLAKPNAVSSPFFHLAPSWALYPMVGLATIATVVASQAVVSGAFSMTKQAIALGFLPRMRVVHTSTDEAGQVYVPTINWLLLAAVLCAVLGFRSSTALGAAYGIAVTGTMLITTILTFFVLRYTWHYNFLVALSATAFFLIIDAAFFSANALKLVDGGWFPLLAGLVVFTVMATWKRGREIVTEHAKARGIQKPLETYLAELFASDVARIPGWAVYLSIDQHAVPFALPSNLSHNHVLHRRLLFVKITTRDVPFIAQAERVRSEQIGPDAFRVEMTYGFNDELNIPRSLKNCSLFGQAFDPANASYFLSRTTVVPTPGSGMWLWREKLFASMVQNVGPLSVFLNLPPERVVELGTHIDI